MTNRSPPMPLPVGSIRPMVALAEIAASTTFPPRSSCKVAARAASGWLAATIPYFVATTDRPTTGRRWDREFCEIWVNVDVSWIFDILQFLFPRKVIMPFGRKSEQSHLSGHLRLGRSVLLDQPAQPRQHHGCQEPARQNLHPAPCQENAVPPEDRHGPPILFLI